MKSRSSKPTRKGAKKKTRKTTSRTGTETGAARTRSTGGRGKSRRRSGETALEARREVSTGAAEMGGAEMDVEGGAQGTPPTPRELGRNAEPQILEPDTPRQKNGGTKPGTGAQGNGGHFEG